ncbi:MAG: helix-turn-helix domain-containing protein [Clostridia bacterium]|nr:helix-turn-helix domain-containing protein [Clostridia bacterium]
MSEVTKRIAKEDRFYSHTRPYKTTDPLYVESMGKTYPDKDYYVERKRDGNTLFSVYVFEYVISGKGYIECDGETYTVSEGDLYLLGDQLSHKYYADKDDPFEKTWINVRGRLPAALLDAYGCNKPVVIRHTDASAVFERLRLGAQSDVGYDQWHTLAAVCLTELVVALSDSDNKGADCLEEKIKFYIDSKPRANVTVASLAEIFHLSQPYLISIFHKRFGITPKQYILQKKMEAAKKLLAKGNSPINEISDILGFSSPYHFSAAFKRITGETPFKYRKEKQDNNISENKR